MDKSTLRAFTCKYDKPFNQLLSQNFITYDNNTIEAKSLWDTGATCTAISNEVAEKLHMIPIGQKTITTPAGEKIVNRYLVDVKLPNNVEFKDLEVCDSDIGMQNIDMLVGMNIISKGDFAVSNLNGNTTFTFRIPSQAETDYVRDIKIKNIIGTHGPGKRKKKKK